MWEEDPLIGAYLNFTRRETKGLHMQIPFAACGKISLCSNARPDIQLILRNMQSGLRSINFPELNWVLTNSQKIIIFCALHSKLHVTTQSVCRPSSWLVALVCWSLLLLPPYVCVSQLKLVCTGSGELWEGICMYTRRQRFWVIKGRVDVCGVP